MGNYSIGVLMYELLVGDVDMLGNTFGIKYPHESDEDYQKKFQEPCRILNVKLREEIKEATRNATGRGYIISKEAADLMLRLLAPIGDRCYAHQALDHRWCKGIREPVAIQRTMRSESSRPGVNSMAMFSSRGDFTPRSALSGFTIGTGTRYSGHSQACSISRMGSPRSKMSYRTVGSLGRGSHFSRGTNITFGSRYNYPEMIS